MRENNINISEIHSCMDSYTNIYREVLLGLVCIISCISGKQTQMNIPDCI